MGHGQLDRELDPPRAAPGLVDLDEEVPVGHRMLPSAAGADRRAGRRNYAGSVRPECPDRARQDALDVLDLAGADALGQQPEHRADRALRLEVRIAGRALEVGQNSSPVRSLRGLPAGCQPSK